MDAATRFFCDAVQVGGLAVDRGLVELEVAGVQEGTVRRVDREGHPVGDRMCHVEEAHPEGTRLGSPARDGHSRLHEIGHLVLLQLALQELQRERGPVDRNPTTEVPQQVWERSDVILVPVCERDGLDVTRPVTHVLHVGQDQVDPRHVRRRERQADVQDQEPALQLEGSHVPTDLADPSEEDEPAAVRQGDRHPPAPCERGPVRRSSRGPTGAEARPPDARPSGAPP